VRTFALILLEFAESEDDTYRVTDRERSMSRTLKLFTTYGDKTLDTGCSITIRLWLTRELFRLSKRTCSQFFGGFYDHLLSEENPLDPITN